MPDIRNEFSADEEKAMRQGRRKSFDPEPHHGGVNIPGLTEMGKPAQLRSENTERAQLKASNARMGTSQPPSLLKSLISPQEASVTDAIYRGNKRKIEATGPDND